MTLEETIRIAATILLSLGGGGAIVFSLSSWLGKVWADRIMAKERANFEREITSLKASLEKANAESVEKLKTDLEIFRDTQLKAHTDKIEIYRMTIDIIVKFLINMDQANHSEVAKKDILLAFLEGRLRAYGYLSMLAPQNVMDAYDNLTDHIELIAYGKEPNDWPTIRQKALQMINLI
jgi:hypothetical protein